MRSKLFWAVLLAGLFAGAFWAQEKQSTKQEQPAASAAVPQAHDYNIPAEDKDKKNPVRFTDLSVEHGKKVFQSQCAMCHGEAGDGKGDLVEELKIHPPDFTKPDVLSKRTDGELFFIVGTGSEKMPGQGKRMPDKQRWQIVNYLRSLEGKTPAKATDKEREEEGTVIVPQH